MDKDNSETMETDEVCTFIKKLVTIFFRIIQSVLPMISKAVSTAMMSEAAAQVFALLDKDSDGKLTPEEITNNFCAQVLLATNFLGSAAPLFNEIRARDHQIAYLRAQIATLEGVTAFEPLEIAPDFEISHKEVRFFHHNLDDISQLFSGSKSADIRAGIGKLGAVWLKLLGKMFLTLVNLPGLYARKEHDKDSFFDEMKTHAMKFHKEFVAIAQPVVKVMPKGDQLLNMLDKIYDKLALGDLDKEGKVFSDAIFALLDMNKDGKITPADIVVYTDLFFKMTVDDDGAKGKLMAIFNSLDLDKSGCLSKDELSAYLLKLIDISVAYTVLLVAYIELAWNERADTAIKEMMEFYVKYRIEYTFKKQEDMKTMDIAEFNIMCQTSSTWFEAFIKEESKQLQDTWRTEEGKEAADKKSKEAMMFCQMQQLKEVINNGWRGNTGAPSKHIIIIGESLSGGQDNLSQVEEFIKGGIDVNCGWSSIHVNFRNCVNTPLHVAARMGNEGMAIASLLLDNNACVDPVDKVNIYKSDLYTHILSLFLSRALCRSHALSRSLPPPSLSLASLPQPTTLSSPPLRSHLHTHPRTHTLYVCVCVYVYVCICLCTWTHRTLVFTQPSVGTRPCIRQCKAATKAW